MLLGEWHSSDSVNYCCFLQVKRLFRDLKVDFTAIELDEVGELHAHSYM